MAYNNEESALASWLNKAKLEQDEQDALLQREQESIDYDARSQLNQLLSRSNRGDFAAPNYINKEDQYLPSGTRISLANTFQETAAKGEETRIRQQALDRTEQTRAAKFNADTARRSALHRVTTFNMRPFDEIDDEAPELEGLRSDIQFDPKTLSYKQVAKDNYNELEVRNQEVADYYGVPVEIVAERRAQNAAARAKAFDAAGDAKWQEYTRNRQMETDKREDAKFAREAENLETDDVIKMSNQIQEISKNPVLLDEINGNPKAYSPRTREAAQKALVIKELEEQGGAYKEFENMRDDAFKRIQESEAKDPMNYGKNMYSPENSARQYKMAEALTRPVWLRQQKDRKGATGAIMDQLGLTARLDEALNGAPDIRPTGTTQWSLVDGPQGARVKPGAPSPVASGASLGAVPDSKVIKESIKQDKSEVMGPGRGNDNQQLLQNIVGLLRKKGLTKEQQDENPSPLSKLIAKTRKDTKGKDLLTLLTGKE